ncbi:MAG TPA: hypothetical protein DEA90_07790 [Opitutae bacterium]|nr:hypothetical protein [Puniceicoccaceae bacterium]HBR94051.1 hypothetical protein [Opitutae bacterium]|tara:strand:- start:5659 stop:6912 length:1254 start_codon:yes stop_codon:yes gene_type:complete
MNPIRVLHIGTSSKGGASHAMLRIVSAQESDDIKTYGCFHLGKTPGPNWHRLDAPKKNWNFSLRRLRMSTAKKGRDPSLESFTPATPGRSLHIPAHLLAQVQIVNFHYLGGQIWNLSDLFASIPKHIPIVVTMHDMNQITGGCHYSNGCTQYTNTCSVCPQLPSLFGNKISSETFRTKQSLYRERETNLVLPSKWLERITRESTLGQLAHRIDYIGYPFPQLKPLIKREHAQSQLQLKPSSKKRILIVAQDLANRRKGTHLLIDALLQNRLPQCTLLLMGKKIDIKDDRIEQLGFINDDETLRSAYASADALCLPSLEENLAQTGIESLAEGTPVVCFDKTGPADYVINGETGIRSTQPTAASLAKALLECLNHRQMSDQIYVREAYNRIYESTYSAKLIRERYRGVYQELLAEAQA